MKRRDFRITHEEIERAKREMLCIVALARIRATSSDPVARAIARDTLVEVRGRP